MTSPHLLDDHHALYADWVARQAARTGHFVVHKKDDEGNYTDRLLLCFDKRGIELVVPYPPYDWTPNEGGTMPDDQTQAEEIATDDPEGDIVAEEEETSAEPAAKLDNAAIFAEAEQRVARMKEKGRKDEDIACTYAGQAAMLKAQNDDAISAALMALAEKRTADEKVKKGPYNRRRLAVMVASGSFNAQE